MKFNFNSSGTTNTSLDYALLLLRFLGAGALIFGHGFFKFDSVLSGEEIQFLDPIGLGASTSFYLAMFAEFICAILVMIGLFTRIALIPLITTMVIIIFVHHSADPFGSKELPLLYLTIFIVLLLTGPGKHSFDRMIKRIKKTV